MHPPNPPGFGSRGFLPSYSCFRVFFLQSFVSLNLSLCQILIIEVWLFFESFGRLFWPGDLSIFWTIIIRFCVANASCELQIDYKQLKSWKILWNLLTGENASSLHVILKPGIFLVGNKVKNKPWIVESTCLGVFSVNPFARFFFGGFCFQLEYIMSLGFRKFSHCKGKTTSSTLLYCHFFTVMISHFILNLF